jgi:hypothetical protein
MKLSPPATTATKAGLSIFTPEADNSLSKKRDSLPNSTGILVLKERQVRSSSMTEVFFGMTM